MGNPEESHSHRFMIELDDELGEMVEYAAAWGKCSYASAVYMLIRFGYPPYMAFFMDDEELKKMIKKRVRKRSIS